MPDQFTLSDAVGLACTGFTDLDIEAIVQPIREARAEQSEIHEALAKLRDRLVEIDDELEQSRKLSSATFDDIVGGSALVVGSATTDIHRERQRVQELISSGESRSLLASQRLRNALESAKRQIAKSFAPIRQWLDAELTTTARQIAELHAVQATLTDLGWVGEDKTLRALAADARGLTGNDIDLPAAMRSLIEGLQGLSSEVEYFDTETVRMPAAHPAERRSAPLF